MQQPEVLLLPTYEFLERAAIFFFRNRRAILHQNSPSVKLRNIGGLAAGDVNKKEVCRKKIGNMRIRTHGEQAAESRNFAVNDDSILSMSREEQTPSQTPSSAVYRG
jgi:hypothetical protein